MGRSKTVRTQTGLKGETMGIPKPIRDYVMKRDHHKCRICGKEATEVHHIYTRNSFIPAYLGIPPTKKNHHPWNLIAICHDCHQRAHSKGIPEDFKDKMISYNKSVSALHFDENLEKKVERTLERLKGKVRNEDRVYGELTADTKRS